MKSKWILPMLAILAAALVAAPASAQTIAYINALQFDLQSFRNQATAGVFVDDIDKAAWAARLLEIDGNRVYTNLSNLQDPALMGSRLITYGRTDTANPSTSNLFDCGSFLFGTTFRRSEDSDYVHSIFFQDAGQKTMFEDLQDGNIGSSPIGSGNDAEYAGTITYSYDNGVGGNVANDGVVDETRTRTYDLMNYQQRQARRIDLGTAKEVSQDLSAGARIFYEKDVLDFYSEGRREEVEREKRVLDGGLEVTRRWVDDYYGPGEEAYKHSALGVSLNADFHSWPDKSVNVRLDVAKQNVTNPGANLMNRATEFPFGWRVDMSMNRDYTTAFVSDSASYAYGTLSQNREWRDEDSGTYNVVGGPTTSDSLAVQSVDDEGGGLALALMGEYRRECYGGQSEAWLAFGRSPYDLDATIVKRDLEFETLWWNNGGGDFEAMWTNRDLTHTVELEGDRKHSVLEAGARWTKPLSSKVEFGGGLIATRTKYTEDYRQTLRAVEVYDRFDDGDGDLGNDALIGAGWTPPPGWGIGDFTEQQTVLEATEVTDVVDELKQTSIRIPFGIRYRFAKKWTWNMGSLHEISHTTRETEWVSDDTNARWKSSFTNYVSGAADSVTTSYSSSGVMKDDVTVTDKYQSSNTTFYYGVEWHAAENLWFYINGIFEGVADGTTQPETGITNFYRQISDVEFYRSLAISAKIML